jgi:hypothetical protein
MNDKRMDDKRMDDKRMDDKRISSMLFIRLSVIRLSVVRLSVVRLSVVRLSVIRLPSIRLRGRPRPEFRSSPGLRGGDAEKVFVTPEEQPAGDRDGRGDDTLAHGVLRQQLEPVLHAGHEDGAVFAGGVEQVFGDGR